MRQIQDGLVVGTRGQGLYEVTEEIRDWLARHGARVGVLTVFCQHTSASLTIQENADPDVRRDLAAYFKWAVSEDAALYHDTVEGPDDMPAHIRSTLTGTCLSVPVADGRPTLGAWQGIFVFEHRLRPHTQSLVLHFVGE